MKKAKWLILLCMLFAVVCLSACSIGTESIGLSVTVDGNMKASAKVMITNVDLDEYDKGACLEKVTIYYAYTESAKSELNSYANQAESYLTNNLPDNMGNGKFSLLHHRPCTP